MELSAQTKENSIPYRLNKPQSKCKTTGAGSLAPKVLSYLARVKHQTIVNYMGCILHVRHLLGPHWII